MNIEPFSGPPDKERLLATFRGEIPDRVPHFEILIEDQHVARLLGALPATPSAWEATGRKAARRPKGRGRCARRTTSNCALFLGQDMMVLGDFWTPIKTRLPDGTLTLLNDRSFKGRDDSRSRDLAR